MTFSAGDTSRTFHLLHTVGARPNYVKMAPIVSAAERWNRASPRSGSTPPADAVLASPAEIRFRQTLVHTGQHYDAQLSDVFFDELGLPAPDYHLGVGSGPHGAQTARVLERVEQLLMELRPDVVLVPGDVNSSMAVALACVKLRIPVAHIEAGLRSFDREMPEEHNRVVIDHVSDLLYTTCRDADANLQNEGVPTERIRFVGNTMIDTLVRLLPVAKEREDVARAVVGLRPGQPFALATLHRPSNVDQSERLDRLLGVLETLAQDLSVVMPLHPRTRIRVAGLRENARRGRSLLLVQPLGYLDFLALMSAACLVLTDSGGIQEETTALGVPCITLRTSTERPITLSQGTSVLVNPDDCEGVLYAARRRLEGYGRACTTPRPEFWDGYAGDRVVRDLVHSLGVWLANGRV